MPKKSSVIHPLWATKFRTPGTELRLINGRYYLYSVSSKYDPILKRAKKITGKMIGSISELNGLKPSKSSSLIDTANLAIREFGFVSFLNSFNKDIEAKLKQFFPGLYKEIIYMAYCRLVHNSPIRDMAFYLSKSMISVDDNTKYSDKHRGNFFRKVVYNIQKP